MSAPPAGEARRQARAWVVALAGIADVVSVLALSLLSPSARDGGPAGAMSAAWPFLASLAVGWLVARAWRRPTSLWPTGLVVWGITWALGVVLRVTMTNDTVPAFNLVAFGVLAATILGWRAVVALRDVLSPPERRRRAARLSGRR
ncbi:DUF3054 domain-containing protein [Oerskovia flava]|uniref:DUF3054 domain-containing protein n=1 Tax=Oerskovia flava TaxID=2986422 RepID=UPI002240596E|nr:DUF3054 domain-containing protein [Oerskovia sp. JB1-3-2]